MLEDRFPSNLGFRESAYCRHLCRAFLEAAGLSPENASPEDSGQEDCTPPPASLCPQGFLDQFVGIR